MVARLCSSFGFRLIFVAALLFLALILPARAAPVLDEAGNGSVSGAVTDRKTRKPIRDAEVKFSPAAGGLARIVATDAEGRYTVNGLPEGDYQVCFANRAYYGRCDFDLPGGTVTSFVSVGADEHVTGIDATLLRRPSIRGRVGDDRNGAALPNVRVSALQMNGTVWRVVDSATTDAAGQYEVVGLWGGSFRLRFTDGNGGHAERYYADGKTVETARTIGVPSLGVVSDIDMNLPRLGSLSGRVQSLRTGEALQGITVTLDVWPPITTVTDRLGAFEFARIKEGEYKVIFTDPTRSYARCYYSGAPGFCNGVPVRVTDGKATTGVNQKLPETGGLLTTVVDASTGAALGGIEVILYGNSHQATVQATTDTAGQTRMAKIEPETYPMELRDASGRYVSVWPGEVTIRPGETVTVTWQLQPIPPPKEGPRVVEGRITDVETGAPLSGIRMVLERFEDHWLHPHWYEVASTVTAADGTYGFDEPSTAGRLSANDDAGQYEQVMLAFHDPEPGETVISDGAMTKFLSKYGRFAGRITTIAGAPVGSECRVYALRQDAEGQVGTFADENGGYEFYAPQGVYKLWFSAWRPYLSEYYDDAPTIEVARPLTLTQGQTITADATLAEWGRFAGCVTDSAGKPIKGAWVRIYEPPWQSSIADAVTDDEGRYLSPYLEDGEYRARFIADGYDDVVWGGGHDIQAGADISVRVDKLVEGIDVVLGPLGAITGRVVDRLSGAPLTGIGIDMGRRLLATTDNDGAFTLTGVRSGKNEIYARDASGKYPTQSLAVTITAPLTTTVEFPLDLPGHVVGRVTNARGEPLANVEVKFLQSCCWERGVWTDADGRYDSGPLPGHHNGGEEYDYAVSFRDSAYRHKSEYYENADTRAQARLVTVSPGQTVTVDAALDEWARVTGRVTDLAGNPIDRVSVSVGDRGATTDKDGRYVIERVRPAPDLTLSFDDYCCRRFLSVSRPITVALNSTLAGQDATLAPWGTLSGRVTDERTGRPLAGIWVKLYTRGGGEDLWYDAHSAITDAQGNYTILPHGQVYRVEFADPRGTHRGEAYPDAPTIQEGADVTFTPGQDTPNIDAALTPTGVLPPEHTVYLPLIAR